MALNLTSSICTRNFFNATRCLYQNRFKGIRCVSIKVVPKQLPPLESHDERNMRLNREMSPHLTIYKPQLTSMLSITHRLTGVALAGYASIFGVGALILPHDFSHYITMIEGLHMGSATLFTLKFILAFPATYHICNGVRHLFWDTGKFLKIREVYSTGYAMLGTSGALTILLSLL